MVVSSNCNRIPDPHDVADFYGNCNILLTGGSGFLGKLLLEKILRLCPNVNSLFLILRAKRGKNPEMRFEQLFDDIVFDRLRDKDPEFTRKIVLVQGDMGQIGLGLSPGDRKLLRTTHIVLHAAATVRFDEPIRNAAYINVRGTKELVSLAMEMPNLKAFIHISTAYSNCVQDLIEEKFYPPPINANELLCLTDILDDVALERLTPVLLGKWPNTYTFTKAIAEDTIRQSWEDLPLCIVRPSIIFPTYKEPVAGWTTNAYTPVRTVFESTFGLLRSMHCDKNMVVDVIPADYVVSSVIVAAWDVDKTRSIDKNYEGTSIASGAKTFPIYNVVSSCQRPITWEQLMRQSGEAAKRIPSVMCQWYYCFIMNKHFRIHSLCMMLLHFVPAVMCDIVAWTVGRKPTMTTMYKKVHKYSLTVSYFTTRQWRFRNDHTMRMWKSLGSADRTEYDFNIANLNWADYLYSLVHGLRVYLLKDPMDTLQEGRAKYAKLKLAHYTLVTIIWGIVIWFLWFLLRFLTTS